MRSGGEAKEEHAPRARKESRIRKNFTIVSMVASLMTD